jgi:endonuclease YncB( thermonuclease family)
MNMNGRKKASFLTIIVTIVVALFNHFKTKNSHSTHQGTYRETAERDSSKAISQGWTIYDNCQLVDHHNNDGDSFHIKLPDGSKQEFRLYFVDTPESKFKRYRDGQTNAQRISQQARYFGDITPEAATELGAEAKEFTLKLLSKTNFQIATKHEAVYQSGRFYCHLKVPFNGENRSLDEILTERGYVRIITQPSDLPDGTKAQEHRNQLRQMETIAKRQKFGGWK